MARPGIIITTEDLGPAVNLAAWICLVVMCLAVVVKVVSKLVRSGQIIGFGTLQADDLFLITAMVFTIGHALAISQQVPAGIGRHVATLTAFDIERYEKAQYASQLLYIWALCMTKLATLSFVMTLTKDTADRITVWITALLILIWTIISTFIVAFQCPTPETWAVFSNHCISQRSLWEGVETINILTEIVLAVLPVFILWDLQLAWSKKSIVMFAFALRILDMPLFILRILYLVQALQSTDRTYAEFKGTVTTEVVLNVTIILACVPFLKPLLDNLQPGWSTSNVQKGFGYKYSFTLDGDSASTGGLTKPSALPEPSGTSQSQREQASQKSSVSLKNLSAHRDSSALRTMSREGSREAVVAL